MQKLRNGPCLTSVSGICSVTIVAQLFIEYWSGQTFILGARFFGNVRECPDATEPTPGSISPFTRLPWWVMKANGLSIL